MSLRRVALMLTLALAGGGVVWVAGRGVAEDVAAGAVQQKECRMNRLEQSACVIEAILADLRATYRLAGEISGIKQNSTTSFTARVSREGRVDEFTYEFEFAEDGEVKIVGKVEE